MKNTSHTKAQHTRPNDVQVKQGQKKRRAATKKLEPLYPAFRTTNRAKPSGINRRYQLSVDQ